MVQVGAGLVQRRHAVEPRHLAAPQAGELREDEPDPMPGLASRTQLVQDTLVHARLGLDEALQVE